MLAKERGRVFGVMVLGSGWWRRGERKVDAEVAEERRENRDAALRITGAAWMI